MKTCPKCLLKIDSLVSVQREAHPAEPQQLRDDGFGEAEIRRVGEAVLVPLADVEIPACRIFVQFVSAEFDFTNENKESAPRVNVFFSKTQPPYILVGYDLTTDM
jgi:hypothetical protein